MISDRDYIETVKAVDALNVKIEDYNAKIEDYNTELLHEYPFLAVRDPFSDHIVNSESKTTLLDKFPVGWRLSFGIALCKELKKELLDANFLHSYHIIGIEHAFGQLKIYDKGVPSKYRENVNKILDKYSSMSKHTCIYCGRPAKFIDNYYQPICEECFRSFKKDLKNYNYIRIDSFYMYKE